MGRKVFVRKRAGVVTRVAALGGPLRGKGLLSCVGRVPVSDGGNEIKNFYDNLDEKSSRHNWTEPKYTSSSSSKE